MTDVSSPIKILHIIYIHYLLQTYIIYLSGTRIKRKSNTQISNWVVKMHPHSTPYPLEKNPTLPPPHPILYNPCSILSKGLQYCLLWDELAYISTHVYLFLKGRSGFIMWQHLGYYNFGLVTFNANLNVIFERTDLLLWEENYIILTFL